MTDIQVSPPPILGGTLSTWADSTHAFGYIGGNRWAYALRQDSPDYNIIGILDIDDFETNTPTVTHLANRAILGSLIPNQIIGLTDSLFVVAFENSVISYTVKVFEYAGGVIIERATYNQSFSLTITRSSELIMQRIDSQRFVMAKSGESTSNSTLRLQTSILRYDSGSLTRPTNELQTDTSVGATNATRQIGLASSEDGYVIFAGVTGGTGNRRIRYIAQIKFSDPEVVLANAYTSSTFRFFLYDSDSLILDGNVNDSNYRRHVPDIIGTIQTINNNMQGRTFASTMYTSWKLTDDYFIMFAPWGAAGKIFKYTDSDQRLLVTLETEPPAGISLSHTITDFSNYTLPNGNLVDYIKDLNLFYSIKFNNTTKEWNIRKFIP